MRLRLLALGAAVLLLAGMTIQHWSASAAQPQTDAANAAVHYIESLQNADGGFPAFGTDSAPGSTMDAVFALLAAGVDPTTVTHSGNSPVDYLRQSASAYTADPGGLAKLTLAVSLLGLDASDFGGVQLIYIIADVVDHGTWSYGRDIFAHSLFLLALTNLHAVPYNSVAYLRSAQQADGGWEFSAGMGSDSNTTAMALQALLATGSQPSSPEVLNGVAYLHTVQNGDGGFAFAPGSDSDPNSTALVIQALVAAGENIDAGGPWDRSGHNPLDALLSFRNAATGAFQYGGADSPFATYQAVPALMLAPFPELETRIVAGPTPIAPTVVTVTPSTTPTPRVVLPGAGSRGGGGEAWWPLAAAAAGTALLGAGALARRRR